MPTTIAYDFGDVVLIPFPFTDQSTSKKRPGVIISSASYHRERPDLLLAPITSQLRSPTGFGDVLIARWKEAGLLKPSKVKPVIATIERSLIIRQLGRLIENDQTALREMLKAIIG